MSEQMEDKAIDIDRERKWFSSTIWYVVAFDIIMLLVSLWLFLSDISAWYFVFVASLLIPVFFAISYIPLGTIIIADYSDNKFVGKWQCMLPSTILKCCAIIVVILMICENSIPNSLYLKSLSGSLSFYDVFRIISGKIMLFVALVWLAKIYFAGKMNKYIDDVTEKDGEIYYQDKPMSEWERKFFKLGRTLFVYTHLPSTKDVTTIDGVMLYKGRVMSEWEMELFKFVISILWLIIYYTVFLGIIEKVT
ncbi:MAG: hypothetical protein R3D71_03210 [Rickettsiales bacterium]